MHHNNFTAAVGSGLNKCLGKNCWLPFIALPFVGSHYLVFHGDQGRVSADLQCDSDRLCSSQSCVTSLVCSITEM